VSVLLFKMPACRFHSIRVLSTKLVEIREVFL
jgi:hypothetical protein